MASATLRPPGHGRRYDFHSPRAAAAHGLGVPPNARHVRLEVLDSDGCIWKFQIFGIALGFNLLFEYDDLISGICFATVVPNLLAYAISHLGKKMAGAVNACIAGFALLCYVLGLLVSQPQIPLTTNVIFPKLSGESAYSLVALLGANIMAHNFYIHPSVVQCSKGMHVVTVPSCGLVCRDNEQRRVLEFCKACVQNEKAGSLYVCGCPGTGKTLSISKVKESLTGR